MKVYTYKNCDTCRKAVKWLRERGAAFEEHPVREEPPSKAELKAMLGHYDGELKRLLNTSSKDYREAKLKDRLPEMNEAEVFALLRENGNLVKRPFLIGEGLGLVGFREDEWAKALSSS